MSAAESNPIETWLVTVHGRVQGVGYREACVARARELGVTGWVRNRMDGTVEALVQGSGAELAQMRRWLREGPPAAWVATVKVNKLAPPFAVYDGFDRRATE